MQTGDRIRDKKGQMNKRKKPGRQTITCRVQRRELFFRKN